MQKTLGVRETPRFLYVFVDVLSKAGVVCSFVGCFWQPLLVLSFMFCNLRGPPF